MKWTELLQATRKVHFEEILNLWTEGRLTQEEAARMGKGGQQRGSG
jgi:hypothetical protein